MSNQEQDLAIASESEQKKFPISRRQLLTSMGMAGIALAAGGLAPFVQPKVAHAGTLDVYNVQDYGAVGDGSTDDSSAFQSALNAIATAGRGALYVPVGNYKINTRISISTSVIMLSVLGDGQGVSNLYSNNGNGILQILMTDRASQITISNLSFFADRTSGGTAIEISLPEGGNRHNRSLVVQNVEMRGVDASEDYFNYGIKAIGQWRPLFLNVIFAGPFGPGVSGDYSTTSPLFQATCGILADGSYAPAFQNCYMWSAYTGYSLKSTESPGPEDGAFYRCFAVQCRIGIDASSADAEPQFVIDTCHINCRDLGVRLNKKKYFTITNCLFYNDDFNNVAAGYSDIQLLDSFGGIVTDNIFHQPANENRIMVDIKGTSYDAQVKDNYFNGKGTGVQIASSSSSVVCVNNEFTSEVTLDVVDASSNLTFGRHQFRGALLKRTSAQSIPNATWTDVVWQAEEYDKANLWGSGSSIVIPANKGIKYVRLTANLTWANNNSGWRMVEFLKNNVNFVGNGRVRQSAEVLSEQNVNSAVIPVNDGDNLRVHVYQTSGAALNLNADTATWFSVEVVNG